MSGDEHEKEAVSERLRRAMTSRHTSPASMKTTGASSQYTPREPSPGANRYERTGRDCTKASRTSEPSSSVSPS
jgi:hypothetical protein